MLDASAIRAIREAKLVARATIETIATIEMTETTVARAMIAIFNAATTTKMAAVETAIAADVADLVAIETRVTMVRRATTATR